MTKLNGWKRIGIIVSLVWVLAAGVMTYRSEIEKASAFIASVHVQCDSSLAVRSGADWQKGFAECNKQADEALSQATANARLAGALAAFVPLPIGWGLVYLALFVMRWVKIGFSPL